MAHPELESKERIIYKCCLNRVFLTVEDTIRYDTSVEHMYICISLLGVSLQGLLGYAVGVYIWTKSKMWLMTKIKSVEIYIPAGRWHWAPGAHTDPSTFVALNFSCLNVNIHYIHCCLDSQKRNLCNNESAQLWYCFWPCTLRHRVGGPKEKLNPNNMGGANFCSAEWKWRKNTILQFKFVLIRLFHGSATSPRTETISWELNDTGWKLCFGLCVKLWEQPQFSKTMRLWDKFQKPFSGHWGLSMLKRNLAFIAFSNCALLSKIAF